MIPHDTEAEELVVGGLLAVPTRIGESIDLLDPSDFYNVRCAKLWGAVDSLYRSGHAIDPHAVHVESGVDSADILSIRMQAFGPANKFHIDAVRRHATARRLMAIGSTLATEAASGTDPFALAEQATADLSTMDTAAHGAPEALSMEQILLTSDDLSPWVIPGMLRQDWRVILVAAEGAGKSTLLRQIALCSSQGLHPLSFKIIMPIRVLLVDLENPVQAIAETGGRIVEQIRRTNGGFDDEALRIYMRPGGVDIRNRRDRSGLEREIAAHQPDLVIIGPVYKLSHRKERESYEDATDPVIRILDDLRTRYGFALMLEHHAPQAHQGTRDLRPFGSQRWLAWPELGYGLSQKKESTGLDIRRFRGDRLNNDWPAELVRGTTWPWMGRWDEPI